MFNFFVNHWLIAVKEITLSSESNIAVVGAMSALNTTALRHTDVCVYIKATTH